MSNSQCMLSRTEAQEQVTSHEYATIINCDIRSAGHMNVWMLFDQLQPTFGRVNVAAHLHSLGSLTRLCLRIRCGNDGDLSNCGMEAG